MVSLSNHEGLARNNRVPSWCETMLTIREATLSDVEGALPALEAAFAADPLMGYFFAENPSGIRTAEFFSMLFRARIALGMPALVLCHDAAIAGVAMGYDTSRPVWPASERQEWQSFEADVPGFARRMAVYEALADAHAPGEPHFYLGVLGVAPTFQGQGAGRRLIEAFCALSAQDERSRGVYLETGSPQSLAFYERCGFDILGEDDLGTCRLWCVYRPDGR